MLLSSSGCVLESGISPELSVCQICPNSDRRDAQERYLVCRFELRDPMRATDKSSLELNRSFGGKEQVSGRVGYCADNSGEIVPFFNAID